MAGIALPYQPDLAQRPYILVTLKGPERDIPFVMLVDSGADTSLIPWSLGEQLGFRESRQDPVRSIRGVGGNVEARRRRLQVLIGVHAVEIEVLWAVLETPALLGRKGVFDRFVVAFDQRGQAIRFLNSADEEPPFQVKEGVSVYRGEAAGNLKASVRLLRRKKRHSRAMRSAQ